MKKQITLISVFVLLNMCIGRLFQESLSASCISELSIIAITGFFFWTFSIKSIKKAAGKWNLFKDSKSLFIQSGIGLSASVLNILISQLLVVFLMTTIYNCYALGFDPINAGLTNNIAVNLLCYFSLLFYFIQIEPTTKDVEVETELLFVSKGGLRFPLQYDDIRYIEASNNCVVIHTEKGKFVKYQSLKSLQELLPNTIFKRVHRSFLVNKTKIDHIKKNKSGDGLVTLQCGDQVKFSRTYQKEIC